MFSILFAGFVWRSAAFDHFDIDVDDHVHLLQVRATKHNRTAAYGWGPPRCSGFGGWTPDPAEVDSCRCYGDTHCTAVPFDLDRVSGREGDLRGGHYQYDGPGVSTFAKAADGSWEIQIFQCGMFPNTNFHPTGQVGTVIKVDGIVVEVGVQSTLVFRQAPRNIIQCRVNGELKPAGYEVHLPTGFHFQCPQAVARPRGRPTPSQGTFCAVKDGQFVSETNHWFYGNQNVQNLFVAKNVQVQAEKTICYDPASLTFDEHTDAMEIATTAIVSAEDVLFSQALLDHMKSSTICQVQDPPQSAVPAGEPADPQTVCDQRGPGAWEHAKDVCSPLQEPHPGFYNDCLIDECVRADVSDDAGIEEEADIEAIAEEVDDGVAPDEGSAEGDPHITSPGGHKFDLDPSALKHR